MIIFVGGVPGAGKSSVASGLAAHLGIHYYDVDEYKREVYREDPDYDHNMAHGVPFCEETRMKLFNRVAEDFAALAQQHRHIVVDETLHKQGPRAFLFEAARKHFHGYVIVWVQASEKVILHRLTSGVREGHLLKDPVEMHNNFLREFEPFEESFITCLNEGELVDTIAEINQLFDNIAVCSELGSG